MGQCFFFRTLGSGMDWLTCDPWTKPSVPPRCSCQIELSPCVLPKPMAAEQIIIYTYIYIYKSIVQCYSCTNQRNGEETVTLSLSHKRRRVIFFLTPNSLRFLELVLMCLALWLPGSCQIQPKLSHDVNPIHGRRTVSFHSSLVLGQ